MKHTPGPWKAHTGQSRGTHIGPYVTDSQADIVALVDYQTFGDSEQSNANAHLIAAAPDLLTASIAAAACYRTFRNVPKDEQEWTVTDDDALEALFAAIDKAEGRTPWTHST